MFERTSSQNELIGSQLLRAAQEKSRVVDKKYSLDMNPFIELYTKKQVMADYNEVRLARAMHENTNSSAEKLGKIFESAFLDSANAHHWLGQKSEVVKASLFDDMHGIDMIATIAPEGRLPQNLIISSDLTFSNKSFGKKFERTLQSVNSGHLAAIKYFHSDLEHFTGRKTNVPRTIIGLDKNNLPQMIRQWVHNPQDPLEEYRSILLHQLDTELLSFRDFLEKRHGQTHKAYIAYDNAAEIINDIAKKVIPLSELPKDAISDNIHDAMKSL